MKKLSFALLLTGILALASAPAFASGPGPIVPPPPPPIVTLAL